jgi:hypothetical protein
MGEHGLGKDTRQCSLTDGAKPSFRLGVRLGSRFPVFVGLGVITYITFMCCVSLPRQVLHTQILQKYVQKVKMNCDLNFMIRRCVLF